MSICPDLLEEIFLLLPHKTILKFKTVSKLWRSILESKTFVEKRSSFPKRHTKILAAYNCGCGDQASLLPKSEFIGDEEIVYLHCDATKPSMACDGLVCFLEPKYITVVNPSIGQLRRFSSSSSNTHLLEAKFCPGDRSMGFGRDKVTGSYKVIKMCFDPVEECDVLDVGTGVWTKLMNPPPYEVDVGRKSVYANGSIYWLTISSGFKILALDIHTEEFHNVLIPDGMINRETQIANLENHLAIAKTIKVWYVWLLEIWSMDTCEEQWSKTYSINISHLPILVVDPDPFTLVRVSKSGNVVLCDNYNRLFKYYPDTNTIRYLSSSICVMAPYLENLFPLRSEPGHHPDRHKITSRCRLESMKPKFKFWENIKFGILDIVLTAAVVAIAIPSS